MEASGGRAEQAACFAAGVLRLFADAVDDYNHHSTQPRSVAALNAAYADARLAGLGLDPDDYAHPQAYTHARRAAEAALVGPGGTLTAEYQRLGAILDTWADYAARMLARGPNPDDIRDLWLTGSLDSRAYKIWPALGLDQLTVARLPLDLRTGPDDTRALADLDTDELIELAEDGSALAREIGGDRVAHDTENMTALRDFGLDTNPLYWKALAEGIPEDIARRIALASPHSFFEIAAPIVIGGDIAWTISGGRDLTTAIKNDPWSLHTLTELGMLAGPLKFAKVDNALDALRDARSAADGARLNEHLRQLEEYGDQGFRVLENGRIRYYGDLAPAKTPGEMLGRRMVREWDPYTGIKRTWHETIDRSGTVRIVRPQQGSVKTHYHFDEHGTYGGRR